MILKIYNPGLYELRSCTIELANEVFSKTNLPWESYTFNVYWSILGNVITIVPFVGFGYIVRLLVNSSDILFINAKFKISRTQLIVSRNSYVPEEVYVWPLTNHK